MLFSYTYIFNRVYGLKLVMGNHKDMEMYYFKYNVDIC